MIMKKIGKLVLNLRISINRYLVILCFFIACNAPSNNTECNDCGGGIIDGYLYKKVTLEDITTSLIDIEPSINIDQCIRYKMDGIDFTEATIVDDCCCTIY